MSEVNRKHPLTVITVYFGPRRLHVFGLEHMYDSGQRVGVRSWGKSVNVKRYNRKPHYKNTPDFGLVRRSRGVFR